jgi:hypothetical protein
MRKAEHTTSLSALAAEASTPSAEDIRAGIHDLPRHDHGHGFGAQAPHRKQTPRTINPRVHNNSAATKGMLLRGKNR